MKIFKIAVFFLFISLYLWFSYIRFYHFIGDTNLKSPYTENSLVLHNSQGIGMVKYVALGDSLSAGVGSLDIKETFVYLYALNLSEKYSSVSLLNLAWPGDTTIEVIKNQLPRAIEAKPDFVTLLIGGNDIHNKRSLNDFRTNYETILSELLAKTNAQITVINIPYIGSAKIIYPPFNFLLNFRTKQFNQIILDLVSTSNFGRINFVDLYKGTYELPKQYPNYYSFDLFHPSGEGYILWSQLINAN